MSWSNQMQISDSFVHKYLGLTLCYLAYAEKTKAECNIVAALGLLTWSEKPASLHWGGKPLQW